VGVAVEPAQAAVRGFLVAVLDDAADLPRERRIRAPLAMVVAGLGEVPEVIDDAGGDEGIAVVVEREAPPVRGAFAEDLELLRARVDAETGAREIECLAVLLDDAAIEDAVEPIEPAVRAPGQRVRQFVRIMSAKAGDDDLRFSEFCVREILEWIEEDV